MKIDRRGFRVIVVNENCFIFEGDSKSGHKWFATNIHTPAKAGLNEKFIHSLDDDQTERKVISFLYKKIKREHYIMDNLIVNGLGNSFIFFIVDKPGISSRIIHSIDEFDSAVNWGLMDKLLKKYSLDEDSLDREAFFSGSILNDKQN